MGLALGLGGGGICQGLQASPLGLSVSAGHHGNPVLS